MAQDLFNCFFCFFSRQNIYHVYDIILLGEQSRRPLGHVHAILVCNRIPLDGPHDMLLPVLSILESGRFVNPHPVHHLQRFLSSMLIAVHFN